MEHVHHLCLYRWQLFQRLVPHTHHSWAILYVSTNNFLLMFDLSLLCYLHPVCSSTQPFQPPPAGPSLAGWMTNAAVSSSIQSAGVAASSMPVPPNQGIA
jgi:hypothetical protein